MTTLSRTAVVSLVLGAALAGTGSATTTPRVGLKVAPARPVLAAGTTQTTFLKVGLTGFAMGQQRRPGANVAIVLDHSGSMQNEKLAHAKTAALEAVDRLGPDDIVSVVAYNHEVTVLVPATKVADRQRIRAAIVGLEAGGNTALFAGVSRGAAEVRKLLDRRRVNRVVLLSDGLANVGPDSPAELGNLGASLLKEGVSVTTIGLGLGYNEDLMSRLAVRSDGNHAFVEQPRDLARIFDLEFGDVLDVVAQEVMVRIQCPEGVRPLRVLGRDAEIYGNTIVVNFNQLYSDHERYLLVELEVPARPADEVAKVAEVRVTYTNMATREQEQLSARATLSFSDSADEVERREDAEVMVAVVEQIATERNELALDLRDQGQLDRAQAVLISNAAYAAENAAQYGSQRLQEIAATNEQDAQNLDDKDWERSRKAMRENQAKTKQQRRY